MSKYKAKDMPLGWALKQKSKGPRAANPEVTMRGSIRSGAPASRKKTYTEKQPTDKDVNEIRKRIQKKYGK